MSWFLLLNRRAFKLQAEIPLFYLSFLGEVPETEAFCQSGEKKQHELK
jgi:hypothetical protein